MSNLLQADSRRRAWILALFGATTILGAAAITLSSRALGPGRVARCAPDAAYVATLGRLSLVAWGLTWAVAVLTVFVAYLMVRLSVLTLRTGVFPPPGTRTLRPIPTLTGEAARRRAVGGIVFAAILLGFAVLLPLIMTTLAESVLAA